MKQRDTVRWYVLTLPLCHKGPARGLQTELERRRRDHEPPFEYFAPSYVETKEKNGTLVKTSHPLLYNYVFVRSSENEIFKMKKWLPLYNFLPYVREGESGHYPYISDADMENLKWVAKSYSNVLPAYVPEPDRIMKGDRVRIIEGDFKGVEAKVIIQPGTGRKDIMVCVESWMWVPLLRVSPGQYEVIGLNSENKHVYTRLDNDRISGQLHQALKHYHCDKELTEADRVLATETLKQYGCLKMETDVMRCKLYSLLLPAYILIGEREKADKLIAHMQTLLPIIKAEQSLALLLVTLYGCTDSSIYYEQAHTLVDRWQREESPKKAKRQLIQRLNDYDEWLGHRR